MKRPIYETDADRARELAVIEKVAAFNKCEYRKLPKRDRLDFVMLRNNSPVALIEVKCRTFAHNKYNTVMITLDKLIHARQIQEAAGIPAFLAVQFTDKLVMLSFDCQYRVGVNGRTDRGDNQDFGLMAYFDMNDFIILE